MDTPLRARNEQAVVLPSTAIARLGFSTTTLTTRHSNGCISTQCISRRYRLICGCRVSSEEECGTACVYCRAELLELQQQIPAQCRASDLEIEWEATSCAKHMTLCSFPFCGVFACHRHGGEAQDNRFYCLTHFHEVAGAIERRMLFEQKGLIRGKTNEIFSSFFF